MGAIFLATFFLSLFQMPASMGMPGEMSGCPFMSHEEVVCSMSSLDHLAAWQSAFTATVPSFVLLILALIAAVALSAVAPNLFGRLTYFEPPLLRSVRERTYTFSYRPLQELFSNGILHPKLF